MAARNQAALAKMAEWGERFEELAGSREKRGLLHEMSNETLALIEEGFRTESSPTGQKWRPKKRPNGQQILVEKNKMRNRFSAKVGSGRFQIRNRQPYANTHQYGDSSRNIPRRQMWPDPGRLPAKYIRKYTSIFQKRAFNIMMGRKNR